MSRHLTAGELRADLPARLDVCPVCHRATRLVRGRLAMHGPDPDGGPACAGSRYSVEDAERVVARRTRSTA